MPLLIKINFFRSPDPDRVIGINFAYYAFLGALVGSVARPFGGWLADKFGGAKVTFCASSAMIVGTLGVIYTLTLLEPVPVAPPEKLAAWKAIRPRSRVLAGDHRRGQLQLAASSRGSWAVPVRLRRDRRRQRLDVPDDPAHLEGAGRPNREGTVERYAAEAEVDEGGFGGARHHRRNRCHRWLPDPDHFRLALGHRSGGRRARPHSSCSPPSTWCAPRSPGSSTAASRPRPRPRSATPASGSSSPRTT